MTIAFASFTRTFEGFIYSWKCYLSSLRSLTCFCLQVAKTQVPMPEPEEETALRPTSSSSVDPIALMAAGFAFDASIYRDSSSAQAFDADEARAKWETARAERVMEEWRSYLEHSSLEPFKSMSVSSFSL